MDSEALPTLHRQSQGPCIPSALAGELTTVKHRGRIELQTRAVAPALAQAAGWPRWRTRSARPIQRRPKVERIAARDWRTGKRRAVRRFPPLQIRRDALRAFGQRLRPFPIEPARLSRRLSGEQTHSSPTLQSYISLRGPNATESRIEGRFRRR